MALANDKVLNSGIRIVKPHETPMPDELRRYVLATLVFIKRNFPRDWRRLLQEATEIDEAKAA